MLFVLLFPLLFACNTANTKSAGKPSLTPETKTLLNNLKKISSDGFFMFGHQDDPLYGIDWVGEDGRSDVKSVAGDFPAVMGFDIGRIELGNEKSLDNGCGFIRTARRRKSREIPFVAASCRRFPQFAQNRRWNQSARSVPSVARTHRKLVLVGKRPLLDGRVQTVVAHYARSF